MSNEFKVEILTPAKEVINTTASEVLLPSQRGELGILSAHEDIVGLLSVGTLKLVHQGNDFWFAVSGGAFRVQNGALTIFAEFGTAAETLNEKQLSEDLAKTLEDLKEISNTYEPKYQEVKAKSDRLYAMQEALRRQSMS
jgi:F-type H+-transporting ATPase subunit epsilon